MQCRNHPDQSGVNTCNQCGSWLCEGCTFEREGRIFCPSCAAQQAASLGTTSATPPRRVVSGRYISWGLLFLFSVVIPLPGLNYMYMGLIKRGLAAMSAFFIIVYLAITLLTSIGPVVFMIIPILYLAVTFDGFQIRHRINAGEPVSDDIDGVITFCKNNRFMITCIALAFVALVVIGAVAPHLIWLTTILARLTPFIVVVVVLYFLFRKKR